MTKERIATDAIYYTLLDITQEINTVMREIEYGDGLFFMTDVSDQMDPDMVRSLLMLLDRHSKNLSNMVTAIKTKTEDAKTTTVSPEVLAYTKAYRDTHKTILDGYKERLSILSVHD